MGSPWSAMVCHGLPLLDLLVSVLVEAMEEAGKASGRLPACRDTPNGSPWHSIASTTGPSICGLYRIVWDGVVTNAGAQAMSDIWNLLASPQRAYLDFHHYNFT